jgi:hypothetical protein
MRRWPSACAAGAAARSRGSSSRQAAARSADARAPSWPRSPRTRRWTHPTWSMGPVITVNSATLVNKGLEVLEAHLLFDVALDDLDVVVHPQSIVHAMVEFHDGSTMAQLSPPDMRLPIQLALAWPERLGRAFAACDWTTASQLTFEPVDHEAFPAPCTGGRGGPARWYPSGRLQRGERGRGGGLPGRSPGLPRHRRHSSGPPWRRSIRSSPVTSTTCSPPIARPASGLRRCSRQEDAR